ncbi:MAG TPA: AraC family transcriptional regulator [Burkholderiales bacterium]|nr:AraC family transcriptional regulator [Burkholderiales bacterium]
MHTDTQSNVFEWDDAARSGLNAASIAAGLSADVQSELRDVQSSLSTLVVDRYSISPATSILVTLHLGPSVLLTQLRYGQTYRRRMSRGDITITPPGEPKKCEQGTPSEVLCLSIGMGWMERIACRALGAAGEGVRVLDNFGTRDPQIERIALLLDTELGSRRPGEGVYRDCLGAALSIHLLRRYSTMCAAEQGCEGALAPFKLRRAIEYIDEHLSEPITLSHIAAAIHMSPCHFARGFKQATGCSPHRYIVDCRMALGKRLLQETDFPITEIAHRVGCNTQSHFSVLFRRATGMAPRGFRQFHQAHSRVSVTSRKV